MKITKPKLSVIIPTYNDASYAERLLKALLEQKEIKFEVIISDANSKDNINQVFQKFYSKLDIKLFQAEPKGPAFGRNFGAKKAKSDWLLFLDADDDFDDPYFLKTLLDKTKENNWATSTAKINPARGNLAEKAGMKTNYKYIKLLAKTKHPVAPGWCILTKKKVFNDHQGFNEKIHFGEDYDYVSRVGKYGFGFVEDTYYYVDFRRAREEGWRLTAKAVLNEIYRHTHGYNLENNPLKYEFGKHKERDDA